MEGEEDLFEIVVLGAVDEFRNLRHEERDLQPDLIVVEAVEDAVELGVSQGTAKLVDKGGFRFGSLGVGDESIFIFAIFHQISGKLVGSTG